MTGLLQRAHAGDRAAYDGLFHVVYDELRALAAGHLRRERPEHTLQPTALVHELFLKMADGRVTARDGGHFVGIAARAMRQILVDHARRRAADKRGGGVVHTTLGGEALSVGVDPEQLLDLDRAMDHLGDRQRRVVELRFFAGLEEREIAELLGITERTVRRDWVKARAWLYASLYGSDDESASAGASRLDESEDETAPAAASPTGGARAA